MNRALIAAIICVAIPAAAEPLVIKATFGFDWHKPKASRCVRVTGPLLSKLNKAYTCAAPESPDSSSSGKPIVALCTAKRGHSEYLLLATEKDCKEERETQLANGE